MTLEHCYWSEQDSAKDKVMEGIKALVDLHFPNLVDCNLGTEEVRAALSQAYLTLSSTAINKYRMEHASDMGINFVIDKLFEDFLNVYGFMPSSTEVIKDSTFTLSNASPMLSEIVSQFGADEVNNQYCVSLHYINDSVLNYFESAAEDCFCIGFEIEIKDDGLGLKL
jgi:hypothetical protein